MGLGTLSVIGGIIAFIVIVIGAATKVRRAPRRRPLSRPLRRLRPAVAAEPLELVDPPIDVEEIMDDTAPSRSDD